MQLDSTTLIDSLRSDTCPSCGKAKAPRNSLCWACYRVLPPSLKHALYKRVGQGYAEAFSAAMDHHGVTDPHFPETSNPKRQAAKSDV